ARPGPPTSEKPVRAPYRRHSAHSHQPMRRPRPCRSGCQAYSAHCVACLDPDRAVAVPAPSTGPCEFFSLALRLRHRMQRLSRPAQKRYASSSFSWISPSVPDLSTLPLGLPSIELTEGCRPPFRRRTRRWGRTSSPLHASRLYFALAKRELF